MPYPNILTNLLGYYPLEEDAGDNRVPSFGSGDITEGGGTIGRAAGLTGTYAAAFVGNYRWLQLPSAFLSGKNAWTLSAWLKPTAAGGNYLRFTEFGNGTGNRFSTVFKATAFDTVLIDAFGPPNNQTNYPNTYVPLNVWTLFTLQIHPSFIVLYISNQTYGHQVRLSALNDRAPEFRFQNVASPTLRVGGGSLFTTTGENYEGLIDSLMVWDRNISADEHAWLYNDGAGRTSAEILAGRVASAKAASGTEGLATISRNVHTGTFAISGQEGGGGSGFPTEGQLWPFRG